MSIFKSRQAAVAVLEADPAGRRALAALAELQGLADAAGLRDAAGPVVVLEGLDGCGKSTLAKKLAEKFAEGGQQAVVLKTPVDELASLRPHFDGKAPELRRAFYALGNYAAAEKLRSLTRQGPVIVDRFWPSTVAYTAGLDASGKVSEDELQMPKDLLDLLPARSAHIWLLLELEASVRSERVAARACSGPAVTSEERQLEDARRAHRVMEVYKRLCLGGDRLIPCDSAMDAGSLCAHVFELVQRAVAEKRRLTPISVNWHYTRECNYTCAFCFHTNTNSFFLPKAPGGMEESKRCLRRLADAGMLKMNFSGGEPFLHPKELGELSRFCKEELQLESVSIVSNGSKITGSWFKRFGRYVDILAVSCDSFDEAANKRIGRGRGMHLPKLMQVKSWCDDHDVRFKLNSVICRHNVDEDMARHVRELAPMRWKVFQCLLLEGENVGPDAKRDARDLAVSDAEFQAFCRRHQDLECLVPEGNGAMRDSYLILDERLRFLNCTSGGKVPSRSLCDVTVDCALQEAGFDASAFRQRGGIYDWSRTAGTATDIEDLGQTRAQDPTRPSKRPSELERPQRASRPCCAPAAMAATALAVLAANFRG